VTDLCTVGAIVSVVLCCIAC